MTGGALDRVVADLERAPGVSWREAERALRAFFGRGTLPAAALDGEYGGRLLPATVRGPLGALARGSTRAWMPWMGKRFHAALGLGDNRFSDDARLPLRLGWPFDGQFRPADPVTSAAFTFVTRPAPSVLDPRRVVLRIDYDLRENPRFWIRDVVDELVEVGPQEYLGQAQVRFAGRWRTAARFALRAAPASAPR